MADPRPTGEIPEPEATRVYFSLRDKAQFLEVELPGNTHQVAEKLSRLLHNPTDKPHWFRFEDIYGDSYIVHTQSVSAITVQGGSSE